MINFWYGYSLNHHNTLWCPPPPLSALNFQVSSNSLANESSSNVARTFPMHIHSIWSLQNTSYVFDNDMIAILNGSIASTTAITLSCGWHPRNKSEFQVASKDLIFKSSGNLITALSYAHPQHMQVILQRKRLDLRQITWYFWCHKYQRVCILMHMQCSLATDGHHGCQHLRITLTMATVSPTSGTGMMCM